MPLPILRSSVGDGCCGIAIPVCAHGRVEPEWAYWKRFGDESSPRSWLLGSDFGLDSSHFRSRFS